MTPILIHPVFTCTLRGCEFDMRHDPKLLEFCADYLRRVADDILAGKVRHFSLSLHPVGEPVGSVRGKDD